MLSKYSTLGKLCFLSNMVDEAGILIITFLCLGVQAYFWIVVFSRVRPESPDLSSCQTDPVSVIICSRNEAHNLQKLLPLILEQDYPCFEVILVDHASEDHTASIVSKFAENHPNLRYLICSDPANSKKPPLLLGLQSSKYDYVLVTDADCLPSSAFWIKSMMKPFMNGYEIVLGAAPMTGGPGILACFSQLDTAMIFLQYASATRRGQSYMGVGRNMAYVKSLYLRSDHNKYTAYLGGDDDLFVSQFSANKISLVYNQLALMISQSSNSWLTFFRRKRRHVSVSWEYSISQKITLLAFAGSHWGFLAGIFLMIFMNTPLILTLSLFLLRQILSYIVLHFRAKPFIRETSWFCLFLGEFIYILYYPLTAIFLMVKSPVKW